MKSLAKGTSSDAINKLLNDVINTQKMISQEAVKETSGLADILETKMKLTSNELSEKQIEILDQLDEIKA